MKFKTFDLRVYRHNDETLLSFDIKGGRIPLSKLLHIPKGKPFKMKVTPEIAEKYRIKQEIKQTEYKGKSPEGLYPLTEVIEEKVISWEYYNVKKENWQDWMRIFAYEYLYDVAELSHELGVSEVRLMHAVLEVIAKRKNGGMA